MSGTWALVACGKQKLDRAAPAAELYTGSLFRKAYGWARCNADHVRILSAKHGVVRPDEVLEPYELYLPSQARDYRHRWAHDVERDLRRAIPEGSRVVCLAGQPYCDWWQVQLQRAYRIERPLQGLGMGQQMAWLSRVDPWN